MSRKNIFTRAGFEDFLRDFAITVFDPDKVAIEEYVTQHALLRFTRADDNIRNLIGMSDENMVICLTTFLAFVSRRTGIKVSDYTEAAEKFVKEYN